MATSPPLSPIRNYMSPIETSPTNSYREQLRRRNSSFSSNHDRSPTTPRSRHRFSNASSYSNELQTPLDENGGGGGGGLGNLADELDQLSDEEYDEDVTEDVIDHADRQEQGEEELVEGARDSGIDVSPYTPTSKPRSPTHTRNFSKPFSQTEKPPDEPSEEREEPLSRDLEELLSSIAHMSASADLPEDPLIPRAIGCMQDLGNQTALETASQRLSKSTNSMAAYVAKETKALQMLSQSLYSPFVFSAPLDPVALGEAEPLITSLLETLPLPDAAALQGLQRLSRETESTQKTLLGLTDTLQMGKQATNAANRCLRSTQALVAELRRERERAEAARVELQKAGWERRIASGWCRRECGDVVGGFEEVCARLRERLVSGGKGDE